MDNLRRGFPILNKMINGYPLCYFDNAATSQKPHEVLKALYDFYTQSNANIYRGIYTLGEDATTVYEHARQTIAQFFNVDFSEIIFTKGTTEGINAIAAAWGQRNINEGDHIVLTELEHHANILPWQQLAKQKNAQLVFIPITQEGLLDIDSLDTYITSHTKIVSITQCSNALGTLVDLKPIIQAARAVGANVMIDGAQSAPHQRINLSELDIDFFACSSHKMLGPTGVGILYINKRLHEQVPPYQLGGGMVQHVTWHNAEFRQPPYCYEAGTPPIAQAVGFAAAVTYLLNHVNFDELKRHEAYLCKQLINGFKHYSKIKILGPVDQLETNGHLVSFVIDDIHSHDVAAFLNQYGIAVRAGNHCAQPLFDKLGLNGSVRASFYLYNTEQEVNHMLNAIDHLLKNLT